MTKQKSKKKTVKGMTLVEIIISLAVFVVAALLMVQVSETTVKLSRKANHMNRKVAVEAPIAEARPSDNTLVQANGDIRVSVKVGGKTVQIKGKSYSSSPSVVANDTVKQNTSLAGGGDLQYITVDLSKKGKGANIWAADEEDKDNEGSGGSAGSGSTGDGSTDGGSTGNGAGGEQQ
jgi:prepilin-type N-terminal cleavage/methylation domain-containing protein